MYSLLDIDLYILELSYNVIYLQTAWGLHSRWVYSRTIVLQYLLTGSIRTVPGGPGRPSAPGRPARPLGPWERGRERDRQTDRQTEREREEYIYSNKVNYARNTSLVRFLKKNLYRCSTMFWGVVVTNWNLAVYQQLDVYSEGEKYLIPCWFCTFSHWQRNDQSIILMVGLFEQWETE